MVLRHIYIDASFTQPAGVTSIGGYLGTEDEWASVKKQWLEYLDLWKLQDFHLTELLAGKTHLGFQDGRLCVLSFARIIEKSSLHSITAGFRDEDWSEQRRTADAATYPSAYHVCLNMFMEILSSHELGISARPGRNHC